MGVNAVYESIAFRVGIALYTYREFYTIPYAEQFTSIDKRVRAAGN